MLYPQEDMILSWSHYICHLFHGTQHAFKDGKRAKTQIWDTAGQERFRSQWAGTWGTDKMHQITSKWFNTHLFGLENDVRSEFQSIPCGTCGLCDVTDVTDTFFATWQRVAAVQDHCSELLPWSPRHHRGLRCHSNLEPTTAVLCCCRSSRSIVVALS